MIELSWRCKHFDKLTPLELYAAIRLRNEVFVVEQQCVFQDADDKDIDCYHLLGWIGDKLAAYSRIVPPGVSYSQASIGRIVTSPLFRRSGAGRALMEESIKQCYHLFGEGSIKIGAQLYLRNFYESFGFEQVGDVYDEDGIPHIHMVKE